MQTKDNMAELNIQYKNLLVWTGFEISLILFSFEDSSVSLDFLTFMKKYELFIVSFLNFPIDYLK